MTEKTQCPDCTHCFNDPRIVELKAEVAALREAAEKYMADAWHHPNCPRFGGNDFPACNCGFSDLTEELLEGK